MTIALVAAVGRNGVIGDSGDLPWSIPEDMRRFRALTMGHPMIMGRATFESIGRALPGRTNIVLTRRSAYAADGIVVAPSIESAVRMARDAHGMTADIFVIGGEEVYEQFLPLADRMELTLVDAKPEGDAFFPPWDEAEWAVDSVDARDGDPSFEFVTLVRRT